MDDFNQNDIFENNESKGEIEGFDNTENVETDSQDDGYYTRTHSDIIQDDAYNENSNNDSGYTDSSYTGNNYSDNGYSDKDYSGDNYTGGYNSSYNADGYQQNNYNRYTDQYSYTKGSGQFENPIVAAKPKKEKKKYGAGVIILASILAAIIGFGASFLTLSLKDGIEYVNPNSLPKVPDSSSESVTANQTNTDSIKNASSIAQAVASKCSKSVVGIRTTTSVISFFGGTSEATGEGSGVIYTDDGYIITNYHVIENAVTSSAGSKIEVFFENTNKKGYQAQVIGYNISSDLAVLKVKASGLKKAEIGNSDNLNVGQYAVTIGAPGGLEFMGSVTYGIISGLNRVVSSNSNIGLIQTDAAINPGNSGGALLDENGKLIGVNSSKIVSEEFEGMGFAIPVNTVVKICNDIITNKDNKEPYVGITISEKYTADVLNAYGYPVGAVVLSVADGSTAQNCGIQKGDIITKFNGVDITEYNVFDEVLKKCTPNTSVSIEIYRSGRYYQTKIRIDSNS